MKSNLENKPDTKALEFEDTRFEKIHNVLFKNAAEASIIVAREIADLIKAKQQNKENCVLGLATGSSPIMVYEELVCIERKDLVSVM
jgi:glucosamine-6-phosphate deaminase